MKGRTRLVLIAGLALHAAACAGPGEEQPQAKAAEAVAQQPAQAGNIDWTAVDRAMGRSGAMQAGGVYKFSMPRSDLNITSQGVQIRPALALGSWLAMKPSGGNEVVAMGDLVLTEEEYNRVIARLQQGVVGQTAVHKHLPEESPAIWWTHVHGHGDPARIAQTVREALALTGTPPASRSGGASEAIALDTAQIRQILGHSGKVNGGVYQVSVPRAETIRSSGIEVPPSMGTATALNFQPTGGGRAAINGDFVMTAGEVNKVIAALKQNGIDVVALHNHMLDEDPRLFFMHFWANDDAVKLARGLRAALDQTNSARAGS
jgi:hypothetical protein